MNLVPCDICSWNLCVSQCAQRVVCVRACVSMYTVLGVCVFVCVCVRMCQCVHFVVFACVFVSACTLRCVCVCVHACGGLIVDHLPACVYPTLTKERERKEQY